MWKLRIRESLELMPDYLLRQATGHSELILEHLAHLERDLIRDELVLCGPFDCEAEVLSHLNSLIRLFSSSKNHRRISPVLTLAASRTNRPIGVEMNPVL